MATYNELQDLYEKKKAEIVKAKAKPSFATNTTFSYVEGDKSRAISLNVEKDVKKLINIASFLLTQENNYQETAKLLEVEKIPPMTWDGFAIRDWVSDIKFVIARIELAEKERKLALLSTKIESIMTPEEKRAKLMKEIESELNA